MANEVPEGCEHCTKVGQKCAMLTADQHTACRYNTARILRAEAAEDIANALVSVDKVPDMGIRIMAKCNAITKLKEAQFWLSEMELYS